MSANSLASYMIYWIDRDFVYHAEPLDLVCKNLYRHTGELLGASIVAFFQRNKLEGHLCVPLLRNRDRLMPLQAHPDERRSLGVVKGFKEVAKQPDDMFYRPDVGCVRPRARACSS
jgi:hypothetical protein